MWLGLKIKWFQSTRHKVSPSKVVDRVNMVPELSLTYAISLKMSTSVDTPVTGKIHTKSRDVQSLKGEDLQVPYPCSKSTRCGKEFLKVVGYVTRASLYYKCVVKGGGEYRLLWSCWVYLEAGSSRRQRQVNCPISIHSLGLVLTVGGHPAIVQTKLFSCFSNS